MNLRAPTLICLIAATFVACGRLDLGDYAELPPDDTKAGNGAAGKAADGAAGRDGGAGTTAGESGVAEGGVGPGGLGLGEGGVSIGGESVVGEGGVSIGGEGGAGHGGVGEGGVGGEGTSDPVEKKSCRSPLAICGDSREPRSCCAVEYVSAGEVVRGGIKEGEPVPAASRVSAFYLGVYEVTTGRFQAFLNDYDTWRASGAPRPGDGAHPIVPNSGWREEWSLQEGDSSPDGLGIDRATVESAVSDCLKMPFSFDGLLQPVNCVSFYEAQAFCIWDGGRLPTDLEWEYAAAGGAENRRYPWGADEPTHTHAKYGCSGHINDDSCHILPAVGSFSRGVGRFGQFDLAGSVAEWTLDTPGPAFPSPCHDCANVEQIHAGNPRGLRGGSWLSADASSLAAASIYFFDPSHWHLAMHGIRCAYDAP